MKLVSNMPSSERLLTSLYFSTASAQYNGCFSAAGCNSANAVTAADADDCCISKDDGLYYFDGTNCIQCVSKWLIE